MGGSTASRFVLLISASALLTACASGGQEEGAPITKEAPPAPSPADARPTSRVPTPDPATTKPPTPAPPATCSDKLKASLAKGATWRKHQKPIPIIDPKRNLRRFFAAWLDVLAGKQRKLRIAVYGDSNTQGDWAAAFLRKLLGAQLGLGGHGFVGAGKPNKWYEHRAIRTLQTKGWRTHSVSPHSPKPKAPHGHAGMVGVGRHKDAALTWRPARGAESPVKRNELFSHVQLHYVCRPDGGAFHVAIDRKRAATVDTNCPTETFKTHDLRVDLGRHRVQLQTATPKVAVFGAAFENDDPGVVIDGIGINSGNYKWLLRADETMFDAGLKARQYDLVVLASGISMWSELDHFGLARTLIGRIRKALGNDVSILVLTPGLWGERKDDKAILRSHIKRVVKEKRQVAERNGAAFWDYYKAMGGERALPRMIAAKTIYRDLLHFPPITHLRMMRKLSAGLNDELRRHLEHEQLDCR